MRRWLSLLALGLALLGADAVAAAPPALAPHRARPVHRVRFPAIHDWSTLKISLRRTMCFGACPSYLVEIAGDGTVSWHGERNVATIGDVTATIPKKDVRALYAAFRKADFFWLFDSYHAPITDLPTYTVAISIDGHSMSVADYAGRSVGMPKAVADLEQLIDKTANTERWIKPAQ